MCAKLGRVIMSNLFYFDIPYEVCQSRHNLFLSNKQTVKLCQVLESNFVIFVYLFTCVKQSEIEMYKCGY